MFVNGQLVCLIEDGQAAWQAIVRDIDGDWIFVDWVLEGDDGKPSTSWELAKNFRAVAY